MGKGVLLLRESYFFVFLSLFSFLGKGPGGFCWEKPNWGRTGDEKGFLLKRWGRRLEKQILQ